jgi:hypothetical protein
VSESKNRGGRPRKSSFRQDMEIALCIGEARRALAGRAGEDAEHLRCRGLLLQCLSKVLPSLDKCACIFRAAVPDRHAACASDPRAYSPSFRSKHACDRAFGFWAPCEAQVSSSSGQVPHAGRPDEVEVSQLRNNSMVESITTAGVMGSGFAGFARAPEMT